MLIFIALSPIAHFMETTDAERALRGERLSGHVLALNVFENARKSEIIS
jgi:hypothetical protein